MLSLYSALVSATFSVLSSTLLSAANLIVAFCFLIFIILVGIVFDMVGVAVTTANHKPFHSMASHRVPEAKEALAMLRNAAKVSSFCNDVIGDICGIISGAAIGSLVLLAVSGQDNILRVMETVMAALVSGLTVGGKAIGKNLALSRSTDIVHMTAKMLYTFKCINPSKKKSGR